MSRDAQRPGTAGFALAETLVAVLLLAVALLGAAAALAEALNAQHLALLHTRAADLAADLGEALRPAPAADDLAAEIRAWRRESQATLPQGKALAQPAGATLDVRLSWVDGRTGEGLQFGLPLALPGAAP